VSEGGDTPAKRETGGQRLGHIAREKSTFRREREPAQYGILFDV
jgi:hypothetical protein